ncbi:hypothetical protein F4604DRAFT_1930469 [Suillus subluteus]|nr:hypothetical protein F4604DRAFT_1930469 [Suillus subluteus]
MAGLLADLKWPPPPSTRGVRPCSSSFDVPSYLIAQPQPHSKRPRNARGEYDYRPPLTATTVSRGRIPDIDLHSQRLSQIQHLNHHLTIRPTHKSHSRSSSRSSVHVTSQDIEDLLDAATDERSVLNARPLYQPCELRTIKSILPLLLPAPSKRRANQAPAHNGSPLTPPNNIVTPIAPVPPPAIRLTTSSPTNAIGQRICLQCGLPGRYKDNKCVEKWGPGPEGPGTVCDRCRNKMKRVERRGTTDANVALATPVKLDCTVRKSFLSVRLLGRRDRRSRKSFRAQYFAWLLCFYRTRNTVVGLRRTLREIGTVTLPPRLRSLLYTDDEDPGRRRRGAVSSAQHLPSPHSYPNTDPDADGEGDADVDAELREATGAAADHHSASLIGMKEEDIEVGEQVHVHYIGGQQNLKNS